MRPVSTAVRAFRRSPAGRRPDSVAGRIDGKPSGRSIEENKMIQPYYVRRKRPLPQPVKASSLAESLRGGAPRPPVRTGQEVGGGRGIGCRSPSGQARCLMGNRFRHAGGNPRGGMKLATSRIKTGRRHAVPALVVAFVLLAAGVAGAQARRDAIRLGYGYNIFSVVPTAAERLG